MKLSKITIDNYRGFYGEGNTIEFNVDDSKKKINLIIARNDTGKTTLLNSIYWCLYGEEQFSDKRSKSIASNKKISKTQINARLRVKVTIVLNDEKGPKYTITRERTFTRHDDAESGTSASQCGPDNFYGLERNENSTGFDPIEHLDVFIESMIPKGISSFFILDGEQLKAIFSSDINYKIKDSIEKVANITSLNNMIANLKLLDRKYSQETKKIDPEYSKIQSRIDECDERIDEKQNKLKEAIAKTEDLRKQLNELSEFLIDHSEATIRRLSLEEERIKKESERVNQERKDNETELSNMTISSYVIHNSKDALGETLKKFDELSKSPDFPPAVEPSEVKQLLKKGECICGTKIKNGSDEEKRLLRLSDARSYKTYLKVVSLGVAVLPEMIDCLESKIKDIKNVKRKINDCEKTLQENEKVIEGIAQELKGSDKEEVRKKREEKETTDRDILRSGSLIVELKRDISDLEEAKKECEAKQTTEKIKAMKNQIIIQKSEKCKQFIEYAKEIKETILKTIKDKIEDTTAQNFIELHWKAEDYERVSISDDFSLSVKDRYEGEIINELSQGAALCFGLAFMSALRNYSGYDVPIIIDSPVGKIDEGNREKIANNLPNQLEGKQVILFVTNAEYTSVFKEVLEKKIASIVNLIYDKEKGEVVIE